MKVRYELSKKQRTAMKAGEPLRLAVPVLASGSEGSDGKSAIGRLLDQIPCGPSVGTATVFCSLLNRGGGGSNSLQSYMGEIVDTQRIGNLPCYELPVIIIEVNGGKAPTRWPAGPVVLEESDE